MRAESDYRDTLRRTLVERCQRNPRYSLRAFARDLALDPARLSDVLNGKKGISRAVALQLASRLGMSTGETELLCDQVDSLHARSRAVREAAVLRVAERRKARPREKSLTLDTFHVVADWHHFAILQLLKLPRCRSHPEWMARALGIRPVQVTEALERLERLELVEREGDRFKVTQDYVSSPDGVPSEAVRKFHEQVLKKALEALYTQPVEERDFLTTLFPVSSEDLPTIRTRIRAFHRALCDEFADHPGVDRVYSLSMQFVHLTSPLKEAES
jgi:uncharacterized protein (TIGR02147 family)